MVQESAPAPVPSVARGRSQPAKRRCTARTAAGRPCRAWAVHNPPGPEGPGTLGQAPLCAAHRSASGQRVPVDEQIDAGGPEHSRGVGLCEGNTSAVAHRFYSQGEGFYSADPEKVTINDAIADLTDKMRRLDRLIAQYEDSGSNGVLARLFAIYTQASSRLSRMLRDRRALSGEAADGIAGAIAQAMDELGTELGVDLT